MKSDIHRNLFYPRLQRKAFFRSILFFLDKKERPEEAPFLSYKKEIDGKILKCKAGLGA